MAAKPTAPKKTAKKTAASKAKPLPRARVVGWMDALQAAGADTGQAQKILNQVRDDPRASTADREHFYRALAQQSLVWFLGAVEGRPLDASDVKKLAQLGPSAR